MSHLQRASCPRCLYGISTGWTEPHLPPAVFCGACDARLVVSPWSETADRQPEDLVLTADTSNRRQRRTRRTQQLPTAIRALQRVPLDVEIVAQPDGAERLLWRPDFSAIACPGCGTVGRIRDWRAAMARCPRCEGGPMALDEQGP